MKSRFWIISLLLFGLAMRSGLAVRIPEPQFLGLSLSSSGSGEVLAAIERVQGFDVQVQHPPLADSELQSRYEGMTNPKEMMITAAGLTVGWLSCERAEFLLLEDRLYQVACRVAPGNGESFAAVRDGLETDYGLPVQGTRSMDQVIWEVAGKTVSLRRESSGGITFGLSDDALEARAEAARRELIANPILLMEEMRKSGEGPAPRPE
jgi:hypothetical protein